MSQETEVTMGLATVVGPLIEVPVMVTATKLLKRTRSLFPDAVFAHLPVESAERPTYPPEGSARA